MLNVLLGAISVMVRAATSGASAAIGMCWWPPKTRSQWISSEIDGHVASQAQVGHRCQFGAVETRPTGLCGLHRRKARVRSAMAAAMRSISTM